MTNIYRLVTVLCSNLSVEAALEEAKRDMAGQLYDAIVDLSNRLNSQVPLIFLGFRIKCTTHVCSYTIVT
jgi:hypothetical protein